MSEAAAHQTCPGCGLTLMPKVKSRSLPHHNRYFAMIEAAFWHWPEGHEAKAENVEDLRAWLQMKAGYREIGARVRLDGLPRHAALTLAEAAIRGSGSYAVPVFHKGELIVFRPVSIAFKKMPHKQFCELNDAVTQIIEATIGARVEEIMKRRA